MSRWARTLAIAGMLLLVGAAATAVWGFHRGYRILTVRTGSMEPAYNIGDAVLIGPAAHDLDVGDVITFRPPGSATLVTHRVASTDGGRVATKGDANESLDTWQLDASMIEGKVLERLPSFGYVLIFLRQPTGLASLLTLGLAVVMLWQMFFPSTPPAVSSAKEHHDPLGSWTELADALEAATASMLAARAPDNTAPVRYVDLLAPRPDTAAPALQMSWSEDTVLTLEVLCARLAGAAGRA